MNKSDLAGARVLLVDDNDQVRSTVSRTLTREGFEVTESYDGRHAQGLLEDDNAFDIIISDVKMPNLSGLDLLYFVKRTYEIPFVLITAFSELLEMREAHELGADGFLSKPFRTEELLLAIASCLRGEKVEKKVETSAQDHDYLEIDIGEFASGKEVEVDLFFRLSPQKYVRVASAGTVLDRERALSYMQKGVNQLYFRRS